MADGDVVEWFKHDGTITDAHVGKSAFYLSREVLTGIARGPGDRVDRILAGRVMNVDGLRVQILWRMM